MRKRKASYRKPLTFIKTPLTHSDLKIKYRFIKKKKVSFRKKFVPTFVCGLSMFDYELPLLNSFWTTEISKLLINEKILSPRIRK